ncbi:MAG TPA: hypothetical protein VLA39_06830 [Marinobacterium sp.]|nr:hypothetical protein [Marinobacterium sp.]
MQYTLRYEKDPTWHAFHSNAQFERKYFWYKGKESFAISPGFNTLQEARQWFELKCARAAPDTERRRPSKERRLRLKSGMGFASKYDRRDRTGRRWTDQIEQYNH